MADPTTARLTSMHFYAWKKGLKTGMYYLRSLPKADAIQFTVDQTALTASRKVKDTTESASASEEVEVNGNGATAGLAYEAEVACESCSA